MISGVDVADDDNELDEDDVGILLPVEISIERDYAI